MQPTRRTQIITAGAVGVAAIGLAALLFIVARSSSSHTHDPDQAAEPVGERELVIFRDGYDWEYEGKTLDDLSEDKRAYALREHEWAAAARYVPIAVGVDSLAQSWAESLHDPSALATPAQAAALLRTIAEHAWARSLDSPEMYIGLIESDAALEWNDPDPSQPNLISIRRRDFQTGFFYTYYLEKEYQTGRPSRDVLREVWDGLARFDHLPAEVGVGPAGARFLIYTALSEAQIDGFGLEGKHAPENPDYWWSHGGRYGMQFSLAKRSAASLIAERPSLTVAGVNILIRLRDGRHANWQSTWYFDPDSEAWVLDTMSTSSAKTVMLVW